MGAGYEGSERRPEMTNEAWARGIAMLALGFPEREMTQEAQKARGDLYRQKLDDLSDGQWLHAVDVVLEQEVYFPAIAVLRRIAAPPQLTEVQALTVFDAVVECRHYKPNGSIWITQVIREKLGPAAADAFTVAGGHGAFSMLGERSLPFVRKAFVAAYLAAVTAEPKRALPEARKPELPA